LGCNWVQGLGTNPINQLALKYKLRTAVSNGDDVVFYDENGLVNATDRYNEFGASYEKMSEMARKYTSRTQIKIINS
jgi:polyamine oxidase